MSNKIFSISSAFVLGASFAVADVPKVAVDIAPVHSLVSKVMNGLGEPKLIIPAEASPHEYQLRPSEAQALQEAKLVFWIGEDLTPWLEKGLSTLASDAIITALLEVDGIKLLDFREVHYSKPMIMTIMMTMMTMIRRKKITMITIMMTTMTMIRRKKITMITIMMTTMTMMIMKVTVMGNMIPTLGYRLG